MLNKYLLLAIDPSSTCTGWALWNIPTLLVSRCGKLNPKGTALERMDAMATSIMDLCLEYLPATVAIEVSSGKVNRSRHGGGGSGLAVYGEAVGAIRQAVRSSLIGVELVCPTESWAGGHSKEKRKLVAGKYCAKYTAATDRGGDIADAICLGLWAIRERGNGHA